ncbi:MAG: hypothetical protein LC751_04025 [Actinobacteria bacterium]|nr:hypothetical protein [Actinomycetota bacterium]MCA1739646.1 hypothetical protein [Actinomycetota bacterium]
MSPRTPTLPLTEPTMWRELLYDPEVRRHAEERKALKVEAHRNQAARSGGEGVRS